MLLFGSFRSAAVDGLRLRLAAVAVAMLLAWLWGAGVARAQQPASTPGPPGAVVAPALPAAAPSPAPSGPTVPASGLPALPGSPAKPVPAGPEAADIEALVRKLEDPVARQELIALLRTLREPSAPAAAKAAAEDGIVSSLMGAVDTRVEAVLDAGGTIARTLVQLPALVDWARFQVENDYRREYWLAVLQGLAWALGAGAVVWWLAARFAGRLRAVAPPISPTSTAARLRQAGRDLGLDVLPVVAFVVVALMILELQLALPATVSVGNLVLVAVALERVLSSLVRVVLRPSDAGRRLAPVGDDTAALLAGWIVRLGRLAVYGGFGSSAAARLGLPPSLYDVLAHVLFIALAVSLTSFFLAAHDKVEGLLRRFGEQMKSRFMRDVVPWELLAQHGYAAAIGLVWLHYLVWAVGVPGGFTFLFRATVLTLAIGLVAQLILVRLGRDPRPPPARAVPGEPPEVEAVPTARPSVVLALTRFGVKLLAAVLVLEAWNVGVFEWLASRAGRSALEHLARIATIVLVAFLLWAVVNRSISAYLEARDPEGNIKYSNRSRTLANVARNVILVLIALFAGATILAEIGVDTGPLLAGAGVVGLAIGFGSQTLVKDIITGMFILMGDTIRVGDVVDLGGKAGAVEGLSMRAVTLRDYNGNVHTIPYSSITTVTNMTKDFSYAVFDIPVAYKEDVDRVMQVLRELEAQLHKEWPYRRLILEPLEMAGVDRFADSAVIIKARIKTRPAEQWRVQRELNRRIKHRFDELGIEIPFPHQTVYFGADSGHEAGAPHPVPSEAARLRPVPSPIERRREAQVQPAGGRP